MLLVICNIWYLHFDIECKIVLLILVSCFWSLGTLLHASWLILVFQRHSRQNISWTSLKDLEFVLSFFPLPSCLPFFSCDLLISFFFSLFSLFIATSPWESLLCNILMGKNSCWQTSKSWWEPDPYKSIQV